MRTCLFFLLEAENEEYVNITPTLVRFLLKFLAVFAVIAVVGVLTPRIAKFVDRYRERVFQMKREENPHQFDVRGIYDLPAPRKENVKDTDSEKAETPASSSHPEESESGEDDTKSCE